MPAGGSSALSCNATVPPFRTQRRFGVDAPFRGMPKDARSLRAIWDSQAGTASLQVGHWFARIAAPANDRTGPSDQCPECIRLGPGA